MTNYKDTLNLPETAFPMRGDLAKREPAMLDAWYQQELYQQIRQAKKGKKTFILHDGPPYANGNLHIGHSVNKILKDIIIKSKTLSGFDSPYVPGWDCHGLPIELKVEELVGKPGDKVSAAEFRAACRVYAQQQIDNQRKDFIRLGVLGDWNKPYLTMDFQTEANIIRALAEVVANGHLHRGAKPVHWCCDCQSSLAEAEVEYYDKTSQSIYLRFFSENPAALAAKFGVTQALPSIAIVIWTTTPWTLPANRAIAVHPQFIYQLIEAQGEYFILAKELVHEVLQKLNISDYKVLGECQGKELELLPFKHPFLALTSPIILGDHVTLDAGTGAVHTAPGHGPEDYVVAQRYQIEIANPVGGDGRYLAGTYPGLDGLLVLKANDKVCEILTEAGAMLFQEKIQHSYPCCWRHKTPIIFRATPQWFISMDKQGLRAQSLSEIKQVQWIPEWGEARIAGMVENRPDWCISRQRTWGVPIPLFIHKITGEIHPNSVAIMQQVAEAVEKEGIQAWWDLSIETLLGEEAAQYDKINDTLDVWFDSGSTSYSVVKQRAEFEGKEIDLYLEGSDQHRGWFMSSLMIATAISKKAPYKQVLTHGFTVDGQGRKMSKSVGNVVSPQQVIDKLGADILRLWVAATDYTGEIAVSDEILKRAADSYRRIRNTARFLLANLNGFTPAEHLIADAEMILLDRWAVDCAYQAQQDIIAAYERYDFHSVVQRIMQFCSVEMGSFYLDIIKDRQYTAKTDSVARRSCQTALYHITQALVRWIAPILSFTADEIWQHLSDQPTCFVFCDEWYSALTPLSPNESMNGDYWHTLLLVRDQVNKVLEKARNDKVIGSSLAAKITLYVSEDLESKLLALGTELRFVLLTSEVDVLSLAMAPLDAMVSDDERMLLKMQVTQAAGMKCPRCWHYSDHIQTAEQLCPRCDTNVNGQGEVRKFA